MKSPTHRMLVGCVVALLVTACGPSAPRTSLHSAVQQDDLRIVRQHIAARSDLNAKDASGWAPLHLAAMNGNLAIVEALTKAGADVNQTGPMGKTPLDVARERRQIAVVQFLQAQTQQASQKGRRRLIDGGLGVSDAMDGF